MKNFPDHNQFNDLEKRLQEYTQQPDDSVWESIDKALRPRRTPLWCSVVDRITIGTSIILFAGFLSIGSNKNKIQSPALAEKITAPRPKPTEPFSGKSDRQSSGLSSTKKANGVVPFSERVNSAYRRKSEVESTVFPPENKLVANSHSDTATFSNKIRELSNSVHEINKVDSVSIISKAQTDSSDNKNILSQKSKRFKKRGLTFYVSVTPQLSFQRVIPVSNDGIVISKFHDQPIFSSERFGLSLEVGVQRYFTRRLEYYAGFSAYQQSQTLQYDYQYETAGVTLKSTDDKSYIVTPESHTRKVNYGMLNLGVNAGLLYHLSGTKLSHKFGAGLSYQHGFKRISTEVHDNSESSYLFYQVFYRNEVKVGVRSRIFVQPVFSHSFYTSQKLDVPFNLKPYRAGLSFGILYDF